MISKKTIEKIREMAWTLKVATYGTGLFMLLVGLGLHFAGVYFTVVSIINVIFVTASLLLVAAMLYAIADEIIYLQNRKKKPKWKVD